MKYDGLSLDPSFDEEDFAEYLKCEDQPKPLQGLAAKLRPLAIDLILKNSESEKPDALIPYLALTYFDRYLLASKLPVKEKVKKFLNSAVNCCLAMAWNITDPTFSVETFMESRDDLPDNFPDRVMDMEQEILLNWGKCDMMAVSLVSFFLEKSSVQGIRRRDVNQIIIEAKGDISFQSYKPSEIAAAAVVVACGHLIESENDKRPTVQRCIDRFVESRYFDDTRLELCCKKLEQMCSRKELFEPAQDQNLSTASQAGEGSSSSSHCPGWPLKKITVIEGELEAHTDPGADSELSNPLQRRPGQGPLEKITETEEELEAETRPGMDTELPTLFQRRPGKEPLKNTEIEEVEAETRPEMDSEVSVPYQRRPGKEQEPAMEMGLSLSDISAPLEVWKELQEIVKKEEEQSKPGKTTTGSDFGFELKWRMDIHEKEMDVDWIYSSEDEAPYSWIDKFVCRSPIPNKKQEDPIKGKKKKEHDNQG